MLVLRGFSQKVKGHGPVAFNCALPRPRSRSCEFDARAPRCKHRVTRHPDVNSGWCGVRSQTAAPCSARLHYNVSTVVITHILQLERWVRSTRYHIPRYYPQARESCCNYSVEVLGDERFTIKKNSKIWINPSHTLFHVNIIDTALDLSNRICTTRVTRSRCPEKHG